jgi:hypothetical protein
MNRHLRHALTVALILMWIGTTGVCRADLLIGLQGYWPFDGNGNDASGNGRNLNVAGTGGYAPGLVGQALNLPGDPFDYAIRPTSDAAFNFGSNDFTIQAWVNYYNVSGIQVLIEKFDGGGGPGWTLVKIDNYFQFYTEGAGVIDSPTFDITTGVWHQLVVRRSGSEIDLFYDDTIIGSLTGDTAAIVDALDPLLIGGRDGGGLATNGLVDETGIWDRALTDAEIATLFNDGLGDPFLDVPEPSSVVALVGLGAMGLFLFARRRKS